jgi:TolB-like protein/DNA-binding winged helix-turn-helix (wHTH) protein
MEHPAEAVYRFGPFRLESSEHRLLRDGEPVSLPHKAFEVLLALVENPGRLVLREDLLKRVWPETFVEEANLAVAVSQLRKLLCDRQNGEHRYIETVRSIGYRFVAPVQIAEPLPEADAQTTPVQSISAVTVLPPEDLPRKAPGLMRLWPAPLISGIAVAILALLFGFNGRGWRDRLLGRASPPHIESIAVLPLENLSRDAEQGYFADGMTESLITELGKISALRVISRTSVMQYKGTHKPVLEIARELNVDAVVEGSVERFGDRARITANLLHARTDRHLWAGTYERDLRDILELQDQVAQDIASEIRVKLTPHERIQLASSGQINPEAHEAYLKGRFFWNKRTEQPLKKSIEYFEQAIEKEPRYALAYVGLADSYSILAQWDFLPPHEAYPKARAAATKALEIDEGLGEAHASLALVKQWYDWDFVGAERKYTRAIELNPNYAHAHHWYSELLGEMRRHEEAIAEIRKARGLDPLSLIINCIVGETFRFARRYEQALEQYRKTLEMDPNFAGTHEFLGRAYVEMGEYEKAISELRKGVALSGGSLGIIAELGHAYAVAGKRREAFQILRELKDASKRRYVSPFLMALIYTGLGEKDQGFLWLEKAYEDRSNLMSSLNVDPRFDPLRSDPRFQDLMRRIGLPQ